MAKKFSIKKHRLRARARRRKNRLKVAPKTIGKKNSIAEQNWPVIRSIEEKMKAEATQNA